jgi:ABC-type multidrug transport system ATPase subunit
VGRLRIEALEFRTFGPIDLVVEPAECVALAGPSGSGKTLFLRALADLDPQAGRVLLDDTECEDVPAPEWRRRVGLLPPETHWWYETVGEHFGELDPRWLERLGFAPGVLGWAVSRLSTGERQRLGLLRVLSNRPQALLLDEPTANLDPESEARAEALITDYRKESGSPVLWVTHDASQASRIGGRRFRLDEGRLVRETGS